METIDIITQLITSVGFPITCCMIMFYQNNKLRETLEQNTIVLTKLEEKLNK